MGNEFDAPTSPTIVGWLAFSLHRGGAVCLQHHGLGQPYPWRAIWLTSDPGNFTEDPDLGTGEASHIPPREKVKLQWRIAPPLTLRLLSLSSALPLKGRSSQIPALHWPSAMNASLNSMVNNRISSACNDNDLGLSAASPGVAAPDVLLFSCWHHIAQDPANCSPSSLVLSFCPLLLQFLILKRTKFDWLAILFCFFSKLLYEYLSA